MNRSRILAVCFGLSLALIAHAATFPYFGPVTGVLKGSATSPITTAATSSDIAGLWTSCSSPTTKFLKADGTCSTVSGTSPAALTKTDDTNVTLTLGGAPTTALNSATSLTLGWTGQLSASRGGTGVSSLGDITKTNDTNVTLTLGGTPTGAVINSTSFTLGWTGQLAGSRGGTGNAFTEFTGPSASTKTFTLPNASSTILTTNAAVTVAQGGTGAATLTGYVKGTGTAALTASSTIPYADISGTPTGAALTRVDDTNVTLTLGGSPTTALLNAASITAGWTGTLGNTRGGTGTGTYTTGDTLYASATNTLSKRAIGSTGDVLTVAGGVPTWAAPAASVSGANPSASVGLSAVNGSATTYLRSDGAPALSQSIAPTWTGVHTYTQGVSGATTAGIFLSSTVPGLVMQETGAAANAKIWQNYANSSGLFFDITNDAGTGKSWLKVNRSTAAFSSMLFGNATDNGSYSFLGTGSLTVGGVYLGPDGSASAPALSFSGDTNTGVYRVGADDVGVAAGGALIAEFYSGGLYFGAGTTTIQARDGTVSAPAYSFSGDTNTGFFRNAADDLRVTAGGVLAGQWTAAGSYNIAQDGSAASPSISFSADPDTGIYRRQANTVSVSAGNQLISDFENGQGLVMLNGSVKGVDGSAGVPAFNFVSDTDTGVYRVGANSLGIATAGANRVTLGPGVQVGAPTGGDQGTGTVNATGLFVNGVSVAGGATTTSTFTATLASGFTGSPTCTLKYRLTGSQVSLFVNSGGTCTSTSTASSFTITGLPAAIQTSSNAFVPCTATDSGNDVLAACVIGTSGTITFYKASIVTGNLDASGWTASGTKGISSSVIVYDLRN